MEKLTDTSRGRSLISPAFLASWSLLKLSYLLNMFISRDREYRADAASVRMTRNPIALAETLYLLSRSWRGAGFIGNGFEMLCIVNPQATALDETEGFWADLLSTHPPLKKRMDSLLAMARVSITELETKTGKAAATSAQEPSVPMHFALSPGQQWLGPFTPTELAALPWLSPLTWITKGVDHTVERASKEPSVNEIFLSRLSEQERPLSEFSCPSCRQPLVTEVYEGTRIYECRFCAGILVESERIPRIIARTARESPCSERINSLAKAVVKNNQFRRHKIIEKRGKADIPLLSCSKCGNPMSRGFYSQAHLIEVDRCGFCGITWFDQDELRMLQCLIENRIVPDIGD
jgi:Zn-finger nucleic acid-binding protein